MRPPRASVPSARLPQALEPLRQTCLAHQLTKQFNGTASFGRSRFWFGNPRHHLASNRRPCDLPPENSYFFLNHSAKDSRQLGQWELPPLVSPLPPTSLTNLPGGPVPSDELKWNGFPFPIVRQKTKLVTREIHALSTKWPNGSLFVHTTESRVDVLFLNAVPFTKENAHVPF